MLNKVRKRKIKYFWKFATYPLGSQMLKPEDTIEKNNKDLKEYETINVEIEGYSYTIKGLELYTESGGKYILSNHQIDVPEKTLAELGMSKEDFSKEKFITKGAWDDICNEDIEKIKEDYIVAFNKEKEKFKKSNPEYIWKEEEEAFYPKNKVDSNHTWMTWNTFEETEAKPFKIFIKLDTKKLPFTQNFVKNFKMEEHNSEKDPGNIYFNCIERQSGIRRFFDALKYQINKWCNYYQSGEWLFGDGSGRTKLGLVDDDGSGSDLCYGDKCGLLFKTYYDAGCGYYYIKGDDNTPILWHGLPEEFKELEDKQAGFTLLDLDKGVGAIIIPGDNYGCYIEKDKNKKAVEKKYKTYPSKKLKPEPVARPEFSHLCDLPKFKNTTYCQNIEKDHFKKHDSDLPDSVHTWQEPSSMSFCDRNPNHPSCNRDKK